MKLTLADCRSTIARVLNTTTTDQRVIDYLNEATQRLLAKGKWVGTYVRYRICVNNKCITWPRQIETIEAIAISGNPAPIKNSWFEFYPQGPGVISASCDSSECSTSYGYPGLADRMNACTFDDIIPSGNPKQVRVQADLTEIGTDRILIQGYDENGQWIRTLDGTEWVDGEYILIDTAHADSTRYYSAVTGIQKPVTNGPVRLWELDSVTGDLRALGVYESDETRPDYRRSLVTGLPCCTSSACDKTSVEVMAKLRFIPVATDTDWVMIGNLPALKLEVMAILKEERNLMDEAIVYSAKAVELLREELKHWMGDGAVLTLKVVGDNTYAASGLEAII
jgi:hypothetical protein